MLAHPKSILLVVVSTALFSAVAIGCSEDGNTVALTDVTDADVGNADDVSATDTHEDDLDVVATDADADDASYTPSWFDCECPNPEEKCTNSFCGLPDAECDPGSGTECPDGYACMRDEPFGAFVCICKGDHDKCIPECERQEDCPSNGLSCSYDDGFCRWNSNTSGRCKTTMDCPDGYYCDGGRSRCQPTGDLEVGESCGWDDECQTGICNQSTGLCDEQCLGDEDCPDDAYCINYGGSWQGDDGCSENFNCQVSCPPPQNCGGDKCIPQVCETTADCDTGDCKMDRQNPAVPLPRCIEPEDPDVDRYCKPEERYDVHGWCYIPGPCWDDGHCDEPYTCEWGSCLRWLDNDEDSQGEGP